MGTKDASTWKLIIYPLMIIFIVGFFLNLAITPYLDSGITVDTTNSSNITLPIKNVIQNGVTTNITLFDFNFTSTFSFLPNLEFGGVNVGEISFPNPFNIIGQTGKDFLFTQIDIFNYLPIYLQTPLLIILALCFIIAIISIITWFIP
jgi:hypothetical protein